MYKITVLVRKNHVQPVIRGLVARPLLYIAVCLPGRGNELFQQEKEQYSLLSGLFIKTPE